jgi:DNA-binding response OmpR family regulator
VILLRPLHRAEMTYSRIVGERVLLVEDDDALREVTAGHLARAGYIVEAVADGEAALEAARRERPAVVVLDLMLPKLPGLDVCRALRAQFDPSPGVVMVTARGSEADMVIGLDAGADDYVVKPFAPPILLARLAALVRRLRETQPTRTTSSSNTGWNDIVIDPQARRATARGKPLTLTPTELAVLARFCAEPGVVLSRKQLLEEVFGTTHDGYARNVDCHITRLRRKLEAAGLEPAPIHTVHGAGYRLGDP